MTAFSLSTLRQRAVLRAQVVSGPAERHTPDDIDAYINEELEEYHLIRTSCGHPQDVTRTTLTTSATTTVTLGWPLNEYVTLPSDFMALLAMRVQDSSGNWLEMQPFTEAETQDYRGVYQSGTFTGIPVLFRLANDTSGNKIARLTPACDAAYTINVIYIPLVDSLDNEDDTYDFFPGTQDFVVCGAAMRILESDGIQETGHYQALMARKNACQERLYKFAPRQNRAGPSQVQNTRRQKRRLQSSVAWRGW